MASDAGRLVELSHAECLELLGRASLGRVGVSISALPAILPVNYRLLGDSIVFRTAPGTKLTAALLGAVVAFEADHGDEVTETGWSVLVVGRAQQLAAPAVLEQAEALGLRPWAPDNRDHFVGIEIERVSGRRITSRG